MPVTKPIIIFGTGRCGTTLFQHMFSEHPNLAWMSGLCHLYPDKPFLNRMLMRLLEYPCWKVFSNLRFMPENTLFSGNIIQSGMVFMIDDDPTQSTIPDRQIFLTRQDDDHRLRAFNLA